MLPKSIAARLSRPSLFTWAPQALARSAPCYYYAGGRWASSLPRIAEPSIWKSLIPKTLWRRNDRQSWKGSMSGGPGLREWNPATFFIIIFILIGSMSIHTLVAKQKFDVFLRQSDVKIDLLRELVERLRRGEAVDVEKVLGTGDSAREMEWERALQEIEGDDIQRNQKKQSTKIDNPADAVKPASQLPDSNRSPTDAPPSAAANGRPSKAVFF